MSHDDTQVEPQIPAFGIQPSPDFAEFAIGTDDVDVASIGGYPVRVVEVLAGTGTLKVATSRSNGAFRDATLAAGEALQPSQITNIGGTDSGTSGITSIRVYK